MRFELIAGWHIDIINIVGARPVLQEGLEGVSEKSLELLLRKERHELVAEGELTEEAHEENDLSIEHGFRDNEVFGNARRGFQILCDFLFVEALLELAARRIAIVGRSGTWT